MHERIRLLAQLICHMSRKNYKQMHTVCACSSDLFAILHLLHIQITGWAVAQTCCISQCAKYRKSGIFAYPWEQNP